MAAKKKRPSKGRKPGWAAMITSDFLLTSLLPILTVLVSEAAQGNIVRSGLSAVTNADIPTEWLFIAGILVILMIMDPLSRWLGGSLFNPCDAAAMYASGSCTLKRAVQRSAAQVLGAVAGAWIAQTYFPPVLSKHVASLVSAPHPGIDVVGSASSEFLLTYLVTLVVLASQRSNSGLAKFWIPMIAVAGALKVGAQYSGPALNPAAAFSFTYLSWDKESLGWVHHLIIYWIAPVAAAVLAKWTDLGMQAAKQASSPSGRVKTD